MRADLLDEVDLARRVERAPGRRRSRGPPVAGARRRSRAARGCARLRPARRRGPSICSDAARRAARSLALGQLAEHVRLGGQHRARELDEQLRRLARCASGARCGSTPRLEAVRRRRCAGRAPASCARCRSARSSQPPARRRRSSAAISESLAAHDARDARRAVGVGDHEHVRGRACAPCRRA